MPSKDTEMNQYVITLRCKHFIYINELLIKLILLTTPLDCMWVDDCDATRDGGSIPTCTNSSTIKRASNNIEMIHWSSVGRNINTTFLGAQIWLNHNKLKSLF